MNRIRVTGNGRLGGLIGQAKAGRGLRVEVKHSFAALPVYAPNGASYAGGMVGLAQTARFNDCYASGTVTGRNANADQLYGGFAGHSSDVEYTNCYSTGALTVANSAGRKLDAGSAGFAGRMDSGFADSCYSISCLNEDTASVFYRITEDQPTFKSSFFLGSGTKAPGLTGVGSGQLTHLQRDQH